MSREEIRAYIATREPMDKRGRMGYRGMARCISKKVEGCYFNVMGLPLHRLHGMLKEIGYDLTRECFGIIEN